MQQSLLHKENASADEDVHHKRLQGSTHIKGRVNFGQGVGFMMLGGALGVLMGIQVGGKPDKVETHHLGSMELTSASSGQLGCGVPPEYCMEPLAKKTIRKMDGHLMARNGLDTKEEFMNANRPFWADNFLYRSVAFGDFKGLAGWYTGEYLPYNAIFPQTAFTQMIFAGERLTATTTTYGRTHWIGSFRGIHGAGLPVTLRITDFYEVDPDGRIAYNFMMIDWADLLRQLGRPVLPPAELHEGFVLPPAAMNGAPAPISQFADHAAAERSRGVVEKLLYRDLVDQSLNVSDWDPKAIWYGPVGIGLAQGSSLYRDHFIKLLRNSMKNPSLSIKVLTCEDTICGAHGTLYGDHVGALLGLAATGKRLGLRFAMHYRLKGDKVIESWAMFDVPGLWEQAGLDMFAVAAAQMPKEPLTQPPPPPPYWSTS